MEHPIKNFLGIAKNLKQSIRHLDQFGGVMGFKIGGMDTYKTRYGTVITMLFYCFIILAIIHYIGKYLDKADPVVQYNEARSNKFLKTNLIEHKFHTALLFTTNQ